MKAVLLAAGRGSRLGKYTQDLPKGMLPILGKSILQIQIDILQQAGINDISIVSGYKREKIQFEGIKYYNKNNYDSTNMVVSLMKAKNEFNDDLLVIYGDIIYEKRLLDALIMCEKDAVVLADENWKKYWKMRYGRVDVDLESLIIDDTGAIKQIGQTDIVSPDLMMLRYIGMLKFSKNCLNEIKNIVEYAKNNYNDMPWKLSQRPYPTSYMTDLIQAIIDNGFTVSTKAVKNGWLEFDTIDDYEKSLSWISTGEIDLLFEDFNVLIKDA